MQLRDRLGALGFSADIIVAQIAEHLTAECRIRPRTAWRLACELSLEMAARHYNDLNNDPRAGMRGSRIWEYEQWPDRGVRPTLSALRILAQVYGTAWKNLLDLRDLEHLPPRDLAEYHGAMEDVSHGSTAAVTARQPLATRSSAPSLVAANNRLEPLAEAMTLTTTNVDGVQLDHLWSDMSYLGNAYARTSPHSVLRQLSLLRGRVTSLLKGRQRPKQTKDLFLMSAKCCAMMAWISADLGRYGAAHEFNSAAWLYGQYADDWLARRWVRTTQSRVEYWAGNGAESARLAQDGLGSKAGTRTADAPLILAEARGWASIQAEREVLDAIGRWARIEDSVPAVSDDDRFFNISKDRRHYMAGTSLLSVGHAGLGLKELRTARQAYEELAPEFRWEAMDPMIRIDTGRAHLRIGELDAVAAELEPFLSLDLSQQPDMVRANLKVFAKELAGSHWGSSKTARGLVDALLGAQTSVPH